MWLNERTISHQRDRADLQRVGQHRGLSDARWHWADEIILVDSFSTDDTVDRALAERPDVRVFRNRFEDFGQQRNFAIDQTNSKHEWILFVDADERINERCAPAIQRAMQSNAPHVGYFQCYRNIFLGRWIKHCSMFPTWQLRLLKRGHVRYRKEGHGQRELTDGSLGYIREPYDHLDLSKGMADWIAKHHRYIHEEVALMQRLSAEPVQLRDLFRSPIDRRRCLKRVAARMRYGRLLRFFYMYIVRGGFLDGQPGLIFCLLRAGQEVQLIAELADAEQLHRSRATRT